jgi:aminoglycoside phosphotransferase (APT) family kinase protein
MTDDPTADGAPAPTEAQLEAIRASEPDPLGLMDVMELIAPQARVTGWHRMPGGFGAAMHRIDVTMPSRSTTSFVLRRYLPETGQDSAVATREAATLEALRGTPVAAPEALWLDADGTVFGRPALAMTLLPGRPRSAEVADDPGVVRGLAEALVSLRWVPLDLLDHLPRYDDVDALVTPLRDALATDDLPTSDLVDTRAVTTTILAHADRVTAEDPSLSHGDFHVGNVLFDGARATGIVDWNHARVADPRSDLAYAAMDLALLAGTDVAEAFLAAHEELRGPFHDAAWWRLRAATAAFDDPRGWVPSWHALGATVTEDEVADRYVAWVEAATAALQG